MNFREKIKAICNDKGMTQKDLADKLNITDISLNKSLRGDYPQLQTLERISFALGVHITELFEKPKVAIITCPKCEYRFDKPNSDVIVCPKCGQKFMMMK